MSNEQVLMGIAVSGIVFSAMFIFPIVITKALIKYENRKNAKDSVNSGAKFG